MFEFLKTKEDLEKLVKELRDESDCAFGIIYDEKFNNFPAICFIETDFDCLFETIHLKPISELPHIKLKD